MRPRRFGGKPIAAIDRVGFPAHCCQGTVCWSVAGGWGKFGVTWGQGLPITISRGITSGILSMHRSRLAMQFRMLGANGRIVVFRSIRRWASRRGRCSTGSGCFIMPRLVSIS